MKLLKKWRDVVAFAFFHDETDSVVLDTLKTSKLLRGNARERGVAIVKARGNSSMNQGGSRFRREKRPNRRNPSQSKKS